MGYSKTDVESGGNGYVPISLQYKPYYAEHALDESIAGDSRDVLNRTYKGKTVTVSNSGDLDTVLRTKELMKEKPVIVSILLSNPAVVSEFEGVASAIVANFGAQEEAIFDLLAGVKEPSGLLHFQMPADMKTVEEQLEDVPHDMKVYVDALGHVYDFAFGMNWNGVICDDRTKKYAKTNL